MVILGGHSIRHQEEIEVEGKTKSNPREADSRPC